MGTYESVFIQQTREDEIELLTRLSDSQLDNLPFGAIRLDENGTILAFNAHESRLTGRQPREVIGRNFFRDVAPCTNVKQFAGKFTEGIAGGKLHAVFTYRFDFKMNPRNVTVTLFYKKEPRAAFVFVRDDGPG